ncbi:MAG: hypothetical protein G01um101418_437 [Parcubacteria group bacterium Gr01-1014_18]|nr:MAG: hypothetical protein Greene041636_482 [Parcubacteria group bacterium Greene0416_36]TSC81024.1 MAG: hypothetical protein G01um101418_437 [Parcubacteria group bacterium Gr01-1014_18]TSC98946.1 MAG: hypothetical protein Greene101420_458 [Parcubacteria group bacterium Greene1014_20]TSD06762.1 MAG: hypothetical protein Greene07142_683 [Parcubacteria group bacterium Greene0714_2]
MKYPLKISLALLICLLFGCVFLFISSGDFKGVSHFGTLRVGVTAPPNFHPGYEIRDAYKKIPPSRFYINFYSQDIVYNCFFDECGLGGAMVGSMGGWFAGSGISDLDELFGVEINREELWSTGYSSLMIVTNRESEIVGLYPDAGMSDLSKVLQFHPELADFSLLEGISQLGPLKVGEPLPFLPEEIMKSVANSEDIRHLFSVYLIRNKPSGSSGCPYYECGYYIEKTIAMGGWYYEIDPEKSEVVEQLGLSSSQVRRGEVTLVILTDIESKILAIHPNQNIRDIMSILYQYPQLVDASLIDRAS